MWWSICRIAMAGSCSGWVRARNSRLWFLVTAHHRGNYVLVNVRNRSSTPATRDSGFRGGCRNQTGYSMFSSILLFSAILTANALLSSFSSRYAQNHRVISVNPALNTKLFFKLSAGEAVTPGT